jgi:HEAT repeat protein
MDIRGYEASTDYVQKLIEALDHPEAETVIRVAGILGQRREVVATQSLIGLVGKTKDVYIARAAVRALGRIGMPEALRFLATIADHPARMVREEVQAILAGRSNGGS